jgi:hypothetical protein
LVNNLLRVQGSRFKVEGSGFRVEALEVRMVEG